MKEYTVYVHKNLKNGKYYVGSTSNKPKRRWDSGWGYQTNSKMWSDIRNSDWNTDWQHGILGKFDNKKDALKYEAFLIAMLDSVRSGYNVSDYGNRHFNHHSEESKKKIRENNPSKPVLQFSKDGKLIAEYLSINEAERQTGCYHTNIVKCCKGKRKSTGGYIWRYAS